MNLRQAKGKVPIRGRGETPFLLVDFPTKEEFTKLYRKLHGDNLEKYWCVVNMLKDGATMQEAGKPYALTRERVRQIEAKFKTLVYYKYWHDVESNLEFSQHFSQDTFSKLEMQETSQHADGSH